jgi:DNA-binding CsgD family transcriptional regulator
MGRRKPQISGIPEPRACVYFVGMDLSRAERVKAEIARLSGRALDPRSLWLEFLKQLRRVIPVDAAFFATVDPGTLLFTSSLADAALAPSRPLFLENELLGDDVNRFTTLARSPLPVGTLYEATEHRMERSPRYRDILVPLAMGDELRVVLRANGTSWGFACVHREKAGANFTPAEAAFVGQLSPYLGRGLRTAVLIAHTKMEAPSPNEPGLLILARDLTVIAKTPVAERWLSEVEADDAPPLRHLPMAVQAVALALLADASPPAARLRTRSGEWLSVHASWLSQPGQAPTIAVIFEPAGAWEVAPIVVEAYDLSRRERDIAQRVMLGRSTAEISKELCIAVTTVQDHLKKIFDKIGVRSRRELVAEIFARHYEPHIQARHDWCGTGWFKRS